MNHKIMSIKPPGSDCFIIHPRFESSGEAMAWFSQGNFPQYYPYRINGEPPEKPSEISPKISYGRATKKSRAIGFLKGIITANVGVRLFSFSPTAPVTLPGLLAKDFLKEHIKRTKKVVVNDLPNSFGVDYKFNYLEEAEAEDRVGLKKMFSSVVRLSIEINKVMSSFMFLLTNLPVGLPFIPMIAAAKTMIKTETVLKHQIDNQFQKEQPYTALTA